MFYCVNGDNMIIRKIEIKKEEAIIHLSDKTSFTLSLETYLNNSILLNEDISKEQINSLKKQDQVNEAKLMLVNKISRKKYSKKECELLLIEYGLNLENIQKIIIQLEHQYLINDLELMEDIINYCLFNKKGINVIKQKIIDRKINFESENILYDYIDYDRYKKNIFYLLEKYKNLSKNKSKKALNAYLKNKMLENGYNIEEFDSYIDVKEIDEYEIVIKEIDKFFKNRENNNENIAKIRKKLLSKGFNYDIIKKALGSVK